MKKLFLFGIIAMLLLCSVAFAGQNTTDGLQEKAVSKIQSKITVAGLENAVMRVRNEETKAHLESVLANITANRIEQLTKLENLVVEDTETSDFIVSGKVKAKLFGIIPLRRTISYRLDENRNLYYQQKWSDFLWRGYLLSDQTGD